MPTSKKKPGKRTGPPKFKKAKSGTPLGWLPAVPEIEKYVRETIPPIASEKAIRRQINYETLSYYYGGLAVLVRTDFEDGRGVEVLAVGEDVWPLVRAMTYEQKCIYAVHFPEPCVDFRT